MPDLVEHLAIFFRGEVLEDVVILRLESELFLSRVDEGLDLTCRMVTAWLK